MVSDHDIAGEQSNLGALPWLLCVCLNLHWMEWAGPSKKHLSAAIAGSEDAVRLLMWKLNLQTQELKADMQGISDFIYNKGRCLKEKKAQGSHKCLEYN